MRPRALITLGRMQCNCAIVSIRASSLFVHDANSPDPTRGRPHASIGALQHRRSARQVRAYPQHWHRRRRRLHPFASPGVLSLRRTRRPFKVCSILFPVTGVDHERRTMAGWATITRTSVGVSRRRTWTRSSPRSSRRTSFHEQGSEGRGRRHKSRRLYFSSWPRLLCG